MNILKSFCIAFAMYSKIPVPQFPWKEEDMKYALCFFPGVGAVIGLCLVGLWKLCSCWGAGSLCFTLLGTAVPILITGGFHVDGFMDTMDALHSYQSREQKLTILKDSHIGAFAVIMLVLYYLLYAAAFSELQREWQIWMAGIGFVLSRALSGISVVTFRPARADGSLRYFSDTAAKRVVFVTLLLQILLCAWGLMALSVKAGVLVLTAAMGSFCYYRYRSYKEFGGITGDTAGYFVLLCEAAVVFAAAVGGRW